MGLPDWQTLAAVSILLWMPFVSDLSCRPFFPPHTRYNEVLHQWAATELHGSRTTISRVPWWSPHFYTIKVFSDFRSYLCELHKRLFTVTRDFHLRPFEFELKTSLWQYLEFHRLFTEIVTFKTALKYIYFLYVVFTMYNIWICWCLLWNDNNHSEYLYFQFLVSSSSECKLQAAAYMFSGVWSDYRGDVWLMQWVTWMSFWPTNGKTWRCRC